MDSNIKLTTKQAEEKMKIYREGKTQALFA